MIFLLYLQAKRTMMKSWSIFISFLLNCILCAAQPVCNVVHYDENSGMAQWHVTQIVQDRQGMMWFSTWNGLNRFDGYDFECFKSRIGDGCAIPTDRFRSIMLNKDGNLWCAVDEHVYLFNTKTCRFRKVGNSASRNIYRTMISNHHGKESDYIHRDKYGTVWHVSHGGRLSYAGADGSLQPYTPNIPIKDINGSFTDAQNNLWLRSKYGVYKLCFMRKPAKDFAQPKPSQVRAFLIDNRHRYWVTSKENKTVSIYDAQNRLLGYLGHDGRLHSQYTSFGASVYCLRQDSRGYIWMGSKPDGLFRLKEASGGTFTLNHYSHVKDDSWSLNCNNVYDIEEDRNGRIWIATMGGGINCISTPWSDQLRFANAGNQLRSYPLNVCSKVRALVLSSGGILLAATTEGLITADARLSDLSRLRFIRNVKEADRTSSLSNNATMNILEDSRHRIFICTESGGVNQIVSNNLLTDKIRFAHYDTSNGLPTDITLSMMEYKGKLIVVGANQIMELNPDGHGCVDFDSHFWRETFRFSDAEPVLLPDGRFIFGHMSGAFTIAPDEMKKSTFVPPIAITGISIQNRAMDLAVNSIDTLVLKSDERSVAVRFAALDYTEPDNIRYAFRLNGSDNGWNYIGKARLATFLDMNPGEYQLEIKSTNADGVWVNNVRRLTIIVKPTIWETGWAMLLYILIGGSFISGVTYTILYIRRIKAQQRDTLNAYLAIINENAKAEEKMTKGRELLKLAKIKAEDDIFMKKVMAFAEEHVSDSDLIIDDMASATATSRSVLSRRMKSILGISPSEFMREVRMHKACTMLADTSLPVSDIAFSCGFTDPKYFARTFRTVTGQTPSDYRIAKKQETSAGN